VLDAYRILGLLIGLIKGFSMQCKLSIGLQPLCFADITDNKLTCIYFSL